MLEIKAKYEFYSAAGERLLPLAAAECHDESDALSMAASLATAARGVEIWLGDQMVCIVPKRSGEQPKNQSEDLHMTLPKLLDLAEGLVREALNFEQNFLPARQGGQITSSPAPRSGMDIRPAAPAMPYSFFAIAEGMRIPLHVDAICACDAEASLVAISVSSRWISVEVWQSGALIYHAPPRRERCIGGLLRADTIVH